MNIEDMTNLIRIYDAYRRLDAASSAICGDMVPLSGSILSELSVIEDLIHHNSAIMPEDDPEDDIVDTEYGQILNNTNLTPDERAKKLLCIYQS